MGERVKRETMCVENFGSTINNGPQIPKDKPYRMINGALNNNPSATALSDDEIEKLSWHNEEALGPGTDDCEYYYRLIITGNFCFDNICYAIMRPCRCVKSQMGDLVTLKTAKLWAMNTITRLFTRLEQDHIKEVIVIKVQKTGEETIIGRFDSTQNIISFIQEDKLKKMSIGNNEYDYQNELSNLSFEDLDNSIERFSVLKEQLDTRDREIKQLKMENARLKEKLTIIGQSLQNAMDLINKD